MTKITKAEFETLPESLKAKFNASGDSYELVEEDVEGLKKSKADILKEKKDLQDKLDEALRFKTEHEAKQAEDADAKAREAGEFAELEKKLRTKITELEKAKVDGDAEFLGMLKKERLQNFWAEKGVLADRADLALAVTADQFDLVSEDGKFKLKTKDGIGDAKELDAVVEGLRTSRSYLFAANGASGSGASGSQSNGGGGTQDSSAPAVQRLEKLYSESSK